MVSAALALVGFFVALYLSLWKIGWLGNLACGVGSCEVVQTSRYAYLFGIPVAFYGAGGFLSLLVVSLVGLQPRFVSARGATTALVALSGIGVAFVAYLTYLEAFVIEAWCRWCLVCAALISAIFISALVGLRTWPSRHSM
jgi:uncharacterized membrane protein